MRTIELTKDFHRVSRLLGEDVNPTGVCFLLKHNGNDAGAIKMDMINHVLWSPHIHILKAYRGKESVQWGLQVERFMRKRCGAEKFLALTPYKSAKKYAENMGFKLLTTLKNSIRKNNELLDQYILEK